MPTTITCRNLASFADSTNLQLFLRKSDDTLINTGGDTGTSIGVGMFSWTVAETIPSEDVYARIYEGTTEDVDTIVIDSILYSDETEIGKEAAESGSGTGARTVTITVNDGTTALQNAKVRMTEGANSYTATTNASGVCTFNLDDATYTVSITKSGYSYAGTTFVVDGTETQTYSMTQITPSAPDDPHNSVLTITCRDAGGTVQQDIVVQVRMTAIPTSDQNNAFSEAVLEETSDSNGQVVFEVVQGATYEWRRGSDADWTIIVIDADAATDVDSIIGCQY